LKNLSDVILRIEFSISHCALAQFMYYSNKGDALC
jgi:hypothetical protein